MEVKGNELHLTGMEFQRLMTDLTHPDPKRKRSATGPSLKYVIDLASRVGKAAKIVVISKEFDFAGIPVEFRVS